jgi:hypothetical protein
MTVRPLFQKRDKAGLLKMVIAGQGFRDSMILHDDEGYAIGK